MDPHLRRYYEALVRSDRREECPVNNERGDVNALMCTFGVIILLMAAAFFACLFLFVDTAYAHDAARPELNGWFDRLSAGRGPCCSDHDGLSVADPDWDVVDGHYRVRLEGSWLMVPDDVVVTKPNLDGRTMVWPMPLDGKTGIRCFMPGSMG